MSSTIEDGRAVEAEAFITVNPNISRANQAADNEDDNDGLEAISRSAASSGMTTTQAWNLYTSHFLSAWNARTYEFAAVRSCLHHSSHTIMITNKDIDNLYCSRLPQYPNIKFCPRHPHYALVYHTLLFHRTLP